MLDDPPVAPDHALYDALRDVRMSGLAGPSASGLSSRSVAPLLAQQPDRARTEALARRAGERLQALQREADSLAAQERTLLGDLRKLEVERKSAPNS